jgi:histidyl-tRNA synthetase
MAYSIQAVRGMSDILPEEAPCWQTLERVLGALLVRYGYQEIRMPLLERTELFVRSIGEATDIVEKEMYTFADRNGDSLTLRPEGTAGCVRAVLEHGLLHRQPIQRLWYGGPMFRHERPQQGRYRQFRQVGVEALGMAGPEIDAELVLMTARAWCDLGLADLVLQINSLGSPPARAAYRRQLVHYLSGHLDALDEDSRRRLQSNPLRVLDSKNPAMQEVIEGAPRLWDHLDPESQAHFEGLRRLLDGAKVRYEINFRLVRGLDYYTRTVFEWVSDRLGAQGTVCAGGRYDGLIEQMGGPATPAVGLAIGLERVVTLMRMASPHLCQTRDPHCYLVLMDEQARHAGLALAERLRDEIPAVRLTVDCSGGSLKAQMKRADRSGATLALVLGEEEVSRGDVGIKFLRAGRPQERVAQERLAEYVAAATGLTGGAGPTGRLCVFQREVGATEERSR